MTSSLILPPALALFAGAALLTFARGSLRSAIILLAPLAALGLVWTVPDATWTPGTYLGQELILVRGDRLSRWFGTVFAVMAFAGGLFALRQESRLEIAATQAYAGGALGVVFAGDLLTLFAFWEVMALASTAVVWSAGAAARAAGLRYLIMHLFGGVLLMIGIAGEVLAAGSSAFTVMTLDSPARWLILAGFLVNTGAPPLSGWLPDAYPKASYSGMVVLSAFTTKTAVFVLMRGFAGAEVLIWIGLFMMFYGVIYAILENDMRRLLAYSIVNQVGVMLIGIGIGTSLALTGVASHAFASVIYTALMLMSAGAVLQATGHTKLTELGGLSRTMPITTLCGLVGAATISAFPLTAGFVTKSMIGSAAAEQHLVLVWYLLVAGSTGAFLYGGLRFPWLVFFHRPSVPAASSDRVTDPAWHMRWAMIGLAALCLLIGMLPDLVYAYLPFGSAYAPYTGDHLLAQVQILVFTALVFAFLNPALRASTAITTDMDWLYRGALLSIWGRVSYAIWAVWYLGSIAVWTLAVQVQIEFERIARNGILSGTQASSTMATLAVAMLAIYLMVALIF